ncbi:MAG: Oxidoreductase [Candidatus Daviesbacteria bacterium GW2011_GWA2_38_24]|uniref:D-lactate dehydrogenase (cytochrome) n=1 Tax=Candidatus Daviesbacteria bacterium GW2011_GWA2_38_24 TaxID=1618422 RepID=A0A0G0JKE7_9BACT|nr:MAG: Oxidoreductase [Candidatus Daviesbacteria bacterium GW2011_GWA2_38_24]KKQ80391.1 MAG: Oxidoreductase [Candidatus Daviesbacteria bacterium GW2011_GWA1_38_7]OGE24712.1 MAG: hypothetical protein A2688_01735 [Candidatus Daviesbacteria bacterium RIFCSPHIGHO2_01_FULL_38_8]
MFTDLKSKLQELIKGELLDDEATLNSYSKDASLFEIKPQVVIAPKNSEDVKNIVKFVSQHYEEGLSITPRSAGTDMSGGAINESILLDMTKHFNKIIEVGEKSAKTETGVFYRDFEKETLKKDLLLPCYPASRELCSVGGMVANNSAGEKTLLYGQTERFIKSLKVILSDGNEYEIKPINKKELDKKISQKDFEGEFYRKVFKLISENQELIKNSRPKVSKNSTGYLIWDVWNGGTFDMTKVFVGSQGTLGIVTEVEFELIHPKKHSKMLVVFLKDLTNLGKIVNKVLELKPESFESYDDYTIKFAMRFLPEVLKVFKPHNLLSLGFQFLPEVWMSLTGGFPKLILLAEFTGDLEEEVTQKCIQAQESIKEFNVPMRITKNADESKKYWTVRRESFNLLRHHTPHKRTAPFIDDIVVSPDVLPEFLPKLSAILDQYNLIYTVAGHIGNGNFHIIPLMDLSKPESKQIISELGKKVYDLVFEYKGSMSAEHNDGLIRGPYLKLMYGERIFEIFKQVKNIFDPQNIFNPNKKVNASFEYSMNHLAKDSS